MSNKHLHPSLARLATQYSSVLTDVQGGAITETEGLSRMRQLSARDDHGVTWTIDPASGQWIRQTHDGSYVADTPPSFGVVTVAPMDVSPGGKVAGYEQLIRHDLGEDAKRLKPATHPDNHVLEDADASWWSYGWVKATAAGGAVVALAAAVAFVS